MCLSQDQPGELNPAGPPQRRSRTFGTVIDDVLAEQVVVTKHHRGAQLGQVLLQPGQLPLQHLQLGNVCGKAGRAREVTVEGGPRGWLKVDRQGLGPKV